METKKFGLEMQEWPLWRYIFSSTIFAWVWLIIRVYVGYEWLLAGWSKFNNPVWIGQNGGTAIHGFIMGALKKSAGAHPDVQGWYASFLQTVVDQHAVLFSYLITFGEIAVGLGLIFGAMTGIAATFGFFMNMNFLLAGTVSSNPVLLILQLLLILAWRSAGWIGLDRYLLPIIGTPWDKGILFSKKQVN